MSLSILTLADTHGGVFPIIAENITYVSEYERVGPSRTQVHFTSGHTIIVRETVEEILAFLVQLAVAQVGR